MDAIKTAQLTKYYGRVRGIESLDLTVEEGDFFGFIGPNGAGKSTTIRTLLGLIAPSSGSAKVLGMDIDRQREAILKEVAYLPSESAFYPGLRGRDMIALSARLRGRDCAAEADRLCQRLQLDPSKKADTLSFGNKKKLAIVCALQSQPRLLILDEPTGGLDPLMQREFFEILKERHESGATIFLSSHILSEVQRYCSRAAVIRAGELIACDRVEALAKSSARRIVIHGQADLSPLSGLRQLEESEGVISFLYSGEMQPLLAVLSTGQIQDLSVTEPDLEEIFMHFYEKEADPS